MKKAICQYCGRHLEIGREFCDNNCAEHYKNRTENDSSKITYFIMGIIAGIIVMFMGIFTTHYLLVGAGIIIDGITITIFPFVTPETIGLFGYKKSRIAGRLLGIVAIIVGVWVGFF